MKKRRTINGANYQNIYNDYKSHKMKLSEICQKYNLKSIQTIYNIIKKIESE